MDGHVPQNGDAVLLDDSLLLLLLLLFIIIIIIIIHYYYYYYYYYYSLLLLLLLLLSLLLFIIIIIIVFHARLMEGSYYKIDGRGRHTHSYAALISCFVGTLCSVIHFKISLV